MEYLEAKWLKRFNVELNREHKVIYDIRNIMRDGLSNSKQGTFSLFFADREDHCEKQSIASIDCNGNGQLGRARQSGSGVQDFEALARDGANGMGCRRYLESKHAKCEVRSKYNLSDLIRMLRRKMVGTLSTILAAASMAKRRYGSGVASMLRGAVWGLGPSFPHG